MTGSTARCRGHGGGLELPLVRQCGEDDFITIEPDPSGRDLRPSVLVKRDHVRDRVALEEVAGCLRESNASHRWMLPVGRMSHSPAIAEAGFRPRGRGLALLSLFTQQDDCQHDNPEKKYSDIAFLLRAYLLMLRFARPDADSSRSVSFGLIATRFYIQTAGTSGPGSGAGADRGGPRVLPG